MLEDFALLGDSVIALCWVMSEKKRRSIFHRNRTMQVRLNTDLVLLSLVSLPSKILKIEFTACHVTAVVLKTVP